MKEQKKHYNNLTLRTILKKFTKWVFNWRPTLT